MLDWILALLPVLAVLILMAAFRWGAWQAGLAGWAVALIIAVARFGAGPDVLWVAHGKALLLSLDVLYIIWPALLFYHIVEASGSLRTIGRRLPGLTGDPVLQVLLLGWVFASFLQGVGGFGVPVAIVAPLLVSLGVPPLMAVVIPSLGHGWAVTFGSLASSFQALMATTGLAGEELAPWSATLLGIEALGCGVAVAHYRGGWAGVRGELPALLMIGSAMAATQYALATGGLWTLGATGAGLVGLGVGVLITRLPAYRPAKEAQEMTPTGNPHRSPPLGWAMAGYGILLAVAFGLRAIPQVKAFFSQVRLSVEFPAVQTSLGYATAAGPGRVIPIFGHAGAILLYSSAATYILYRLRGFYGDEARPGAKISRATLKRAVKPTFGILAMVSMATVMGMAGMTERLATGLGVVGATLYPLIAPWIGAVGAFMTGSNTNSNVVFAALQRDAARLLGLNVPLILGAQTAAAAIGSILAPTKLIVGASTVGMTGREGEVLRVALSYGVVLIGLVSVVAMVAAAFV